MSVKLPPRDAQQRKADVLAKLQHDVDCWVASASATGEAYLIPLSYVWDGKRIILATLRKSRTVRNLQRAGWARLAWGPTRDVVILEGSVTVHALHEVEPDLAERFARVTGFDPRHLPTEPKYVYLRVTPTRIQAWREENELDGRDLMRDGQWLV
jgi:hypothetical protein